MPNAAGNQQSPPRGPRSRQMSAEQQAVMQRRAIALGGAVLFLIVAVLLIKGCQSQAQERGIKDFVTQANSILTQSNQSSRDFFNLLKDPGDAGATEIETSVNEQRSLASELVRQASNLDPPSDLDQAQQYLVETLEFRRDGLNEISEQISQALSEEDPEAATEKIAANMQQFLTSDVIYSQRAYAYMNQAVKDREIEGVTIPSSQFLPSLEWLDPAVVDDVLSRARGGTGSDEPVAPGTHGTGITGVSAQPSGTALVEGSSNDLANAKSISVDVQNQGENDEKDVEVSLQISGSGTPIRLNKQIADISAGETVKVEIPLTRTPAAGSNATLKITVKRVPGEENTDNNEQTFNVEF